MRGEKARVSGEGSKGARGTRPEARTGLLTPSNPSPLTATSHFASLTSHPDSESVGAAVSRARRILEDAGIPDSRREADELYAALVGRATSAAWLERAERAPAALRERLEAAAGLRAAGSPQAYAAGRANFRGHWLAVDRRVLIPRPETEGLVDLVLEWLRGAAPRGGGAPLAVDVGTGSGAIAVALALEWPGLRVVAVDPSAGALAVARANVAAHALGGRVALAQGRLVGPVEPGACDVVVSNPPYVATGDWERLDASVRDHEPREALDGGPNGLAVVRGLVSEARTALRPGGLLALEVDAPRAESVADLAAASGFEGITVSQDLFERPRYVRARRPADGSD